MLPSLRFQISTTWLGLVARALNGRPSSSSFTKFGALLFGSSIMPLRRSRSLAQIQPQHRHQGSLIAPLSPAASNLPQSSTSTQSCSSSIDDSTKASRRASLLGPIKQSPPNPEDSVETLDATVGSRKWSSRPRLPSKSSTASESSQSHSGSSRFQNRSKSSKNMSTSNSNDNRTKQHQSSHMLKTGRRGNPFAKVSSRSHTSRVPD